MIREAIEKIVELTKPDYKNVGDRQFVVFPGGRIEEIKPKPDFPDILELHSLSALVAVVDEEFALNELGNLIPGTLFIEAYDHKHVKAYSAPLDKLNGKRGFLYSAKAKDVPEWNANVELSFESALIAIRTQFQKTEDTDYLLKLLSDISNGAQITYTDNGVATTVVTQKGVSLQGKDLIRPIVKLRPYRTFQEVEQPESEFHIRVNGRGIKFIEADGGMWKLAARKTIAAYLSDALAELVEEGDVIVTI